MKMLPPRDYWPTDGWHKADAQAMGVNLSMLEQMQEYIHVHIRGLLGLVIVRHGYLVFEEYYQSFHEKSYVSISSATKSIISMLVGVALLQGKLTSIEQHVLDFFPDYAVHVTDTFKQTMTLHHLLTLTTGFAEELPPQFWLNPVKAALERPVIHQPGTVFRYDSSAVDLLSGILTIVAGMNAAAFADTTLFKTLGIWRDEAARFTWRNDLQGKHSWHGDALWDEQQGYLWKIDPQGNSTGGFGAHLTAREMAKLGYLYLNSGVWDGIQLVPADYVADSIRKHSDGGFPLNTAYGYLWWLNQHNGKDAFFASGFGGKLIYVIPAFDLVIATIASTERTREHPEQADEIVQLISRFIVPAVSG